MTTDLTVTVALGDSVVTIGQRFVVTRFEDGTEIHAWSVYDETSMKTARDLGYQGTDEEVIDAMTREHDLTHTVLAVARGLRYSPTLWRVAHGLELDEDDVRHEEQMVLDAQRSRNRKFGS